VERVPARYDIQFSYRACKRFKALDKSRSFDLVHGHGFSAFGFLIAKKMGALKVPVVSTFHCVRHTQRRITRETMKMSGGSGVNPIGPSRPRLAFEALQERLVVEGSDGLIAVSEEIRKNLIDDYGVSPEKVCMAGNGVDTVHFSPSERSPIGMASRINLLWVGKFTGRKGEMDLISACHMLRGKEVDFRLKMVGDGSECEKANQYITDLNLNEYIEVITYIPNHKMAELYRQAHVFVFPSVWEGMPKVILEAMACGCPVVATDIPGCRELVMDGKSGFLVPVGRPDRLRDALQSLYENKGLLDEMGRRSRRIIEKDYTWDAVAHRIEDYYHEVLRKRQVLQARRQPANGG
jgi:glycosyltransferase involved in cell wall biosynthesis